MFASPSRAPRRPLRVVAVPRARNRDINPYNALLYAALDDCGIEALEGNAVNLLGPKPDILHIHWPEYLFSARSTWRAIVNAATFMAMIAYFGARKTRIVWTVHNLAAHEAMHPRLEKRMWRWFIRRVDAMISMSPTGQKAALDRYPELNQTPHFVIPHGHYSSVYPAHATRAEARARFGIADDQQLICFFGTVRSYKGVPALLSAFSRVQDPTWRLIVGGSCTDPALHDTLTHFAQQDNRMRLDLSFIPDDQVQYYLRAADLVVLPYRDILNSGSAILALTFGAHVLVPGLGAANDLAAIIGPDWIRTYTGELTPELLQQAMAWAHEQHKQQHPPLDALAWERIADQTREAYREVLLTPPTRLRRKRARVHARQGHTRQWSLTNRVGNPRYGQNRTLRWVDGFSIERRKELTTARGTILRQDLKSIIRSPGDSIGIR